MAAEGGGAGRCDEAIRRGFVTETVGHVGQWLRGNQRCVSSG
ncbi:hypothetical protein WI665_19800 [Vibrio cholerae]